MSLLTIFLVLLAVGIGLWLVNQYVPMDTKIKKILNIAVVVITVIWLLNGLGVFKALEGANI